MTTQRRKWSRVKRTVTITEDNIAEVFSLPCVRSISKRDGKICVLARVGIRKYRFCDVGDMLAEDEHGEWTYMQKK